MAAIPVHGATLTDVGVVTGAESAAILHFQLVWFEPLFVLRFIAKATAHRAAMRVRCWLKTRPQLCSHCINGSCA